MLFVESISGKSRTSVLAGCMKERRVDKKILLLDRVPTTDSRLMSFKRGLNFPSVELHALFGSGIIRIYPFRRKATVLKF